MTSCSANNSSSLPTGPPGPTGATGAAGANGQDGTTVLYNSLTPVSTSTGGFDILQSYTLPINKLDTNGDSLEVISMLDVDVTTSLAYVRLYMAGSSTLTGTPASFFIYPGTKICALRAIITRQSATTVFVQFFVEFSGGANLTTTGSQHFYSTGVVVNNLTTNTNTIEIRGAETNGSNVLTAHNLLITKLST